MARLLCIVAAQRAGTTALQSALQATGEFRNFGEIFHDGDRARDDPSSFVNFISSRDIRLAEAFSYSGGESILERYIVHLERLTDGAIPIVDVKFNSWNTLARPWQFPHEEPLFLKLLKRRGAFFAFVLRRDLCAQVVSEYIAQKARKWHEVTREDIADPFEVDIGEVRRLAKLILQSECMLNGFLETYPYFHRICYEDLYVNECVSPELIGSINTAFSIGLRSGIYPTISRNRVTKQEVVTNYAEAEAAVERVIRENGRLSFAHVSKVGA